MVLKPMVVIGRGGLSMLTKKELEAYLDGRNAPEVDAGQMSHEIIRRSREQIAASKALLQQEVPKIWHPEPPTQ